MGRKVIAKCATLHAPYSPTPWAHNTHLQSSLGLLRRATIANKYTRQVRHARGFHVIRVAADRCHAALQLVPRRGPAVAACLLQEVCYRRHATTTTSSGRQQQHPATRSPLDAPPLKPPAPCPADHSGR